MQTASRSDLYSFAILGAVLLLVSASCDTVGTLQRTVRAREGLKSYHSGNMVAVQVFRWNPDDGQSVQTRSMTFEGFNTSLQEPLTITSYISLLSAQIHRRHKFLVVDITIDNRSSDELVIYPNQINLDIERTNVRPKQDNAHITADYLMVMEDDQAVGYMGTHVPEQHPILLDFEGRQSLQILEQLYIPAEVLSDLPSPLIDALHLYGNRIRLRSIFLQDSFLDITTAVFRFNLSVPTENNEHYQVKVEIQGVDYQD